MGSIDGLHVAPTSLGSLSVPASKDLPVLPLLAYYTPLSHSASVSKLQPSSPTRINNPTSSKFQHSSVMPASGIISRPRTCGYGIRSGPQLLLSLLLFVVTNVVAVIRIIRCLLLARYVLLLSDDLVCCTGFVICTFAIGFSSLCLMAPVLSASRHDSFSSWRSLLPPYRTSIFCHSCRQKAFYCQTGRSKFYTLLTELLRQCLHRSGAAAPRGS